MLLLKLNLVLSMANARYTKKIFFEISVHFQVRGFRLGVQPNTVHPSRENKTSPRSAASGSVLYMYMSMYLYL